MTQIVLQKNVGVDGLVYFQLQATDLPEHFLGLAADIQFDGDFEAAGYRGMEWGQSMQDLPVGQQPINMVKAFPEQGKVVAGITFKANNLPVVADGVLASFVFEKDVLSASGFQNRVLSVYDGVRRDVSGVEWQVLQEAPRTVQPVIKQNAVGGDAVFAVSIGQEQLLSGTGDELQTNYGEQALMEALNFQVTEMDWSWMWIWGVPALVLLVIIGWGTKKWFEKRQNRQVRGWEGAGMKRAGRGGSAGADFA